MMALVVKNTFLDIASDDDDAEPCRVGRRCHSTPPNFKPLTACKVSTLNVTLFDDVDGLDTDPDTFYSVLGTPDSSPPPSLSGHGNSSLDGSSDHKMAAVTTTWSRDSNLDMSPIDYFGWSEDEADAAAGPVVQLCCATPTSSLGSPRELAACSSGRSRFCQAPEGGGTEMDRVLCYLTDCKVHTLEFAGNDCEVDSTSDKMKMVDCDADIEKNTHQTSLSISSAWQQAQEHHRWGANLANKDKSFAAEECQQPENEHRSWQAKQANRCKYSRSQDHKEPKIEHHGGCHANVVNCCKFSPEEGHQEPENEPGTTMEEECVANGFRTRTRLKMGAPTFQPGEARMQVESEARMDAVTACIRLVLVSCGQTHRINVEKGIMGVSSTLISALLQCGPHASARAYEVISLTKQAVDAITTRLGTTYLLSARVQKEDCGYSLRASIAFVPEGAQDCMCWDMFKNGHCPRRSQCRWYHPVDSHIGKIKATIKHIEGSEVSSEEQLGSYSPVRKHKISIGEFAY